MAIKEVFHEFRCHSFSLMHSLFPDSIESWNNIGSEFASLPPISKYKEALLSFIRPAKKLCIWYSQSYRYQKTVSTAIGS